MTAIYRTRIGHRRSAPVTHAFEHRSFSWLVDVGALGTALRPSDVPRAAASLVSFRPGDHVGGDTGKTWYDNVLAFVHTRRPDLDGCRLLALTTPRSLGYVFNPITLYWFLRGEQVQAVLAEVHNTYGERHCYLVEPDERARADTDKGMYVSPFNDVSGRYSMRVPLPQDGIDVRITLHRDDEPPLVTTWRGVRRAAPPRIRTVVQAALTPHLVTALIRLEGIRLWGRRVPLVPRPPHQTQESV